MRPRANVLILCSDHQPDAEHIAWIMRTRMTVEPWVNPVKPEQWFLDAPRLVILFSAMQAPDTPALDALLAPWLLMDPLLPVLYVAPQARPLPAVFSRAHIGGSTAGLLDKMRVMLARKRGPKMVIWQARPLPMMPEAEEAIEQDEPRPMVKLAKTRRALPQTSSQIDRMLALAGRNQARHLA